MTNPNYTPHHPKWLRRRKKIFWWVGHWPDIKFICRELTGIFIAAYAILLLLIYRAVMAGPEAYAALFDRLSHPVILAFHLVALLFAILHSITWFNLAPRALVFRFGSWHVPDALIAGAHFAGWLAISAAIAWLYVVA